MDPLLLRQLIVNDISLVFAERQTLLEQLRIAETHGSVDASRLTAMGFGALAAYVLSKIAGVSPMGTLAMGALGAAAGSYFAPKPTGIGFGRGYYYLQ